MLSKLFFAFTNNILVNNLLIFFRLDPWVTSKLAIYKRIRINKNLSPELMAGFSNLHEVSETRLRTHQDLKEIVANFLSPGDHILDIGSGAGVYLKDFAKDYHTTGIDLNIDMIEAGRKHVPSATFIYEDFLKYDFKEKFKLIYSISVIEFIPPSCLDLFFKKVANLLEPGGIIYLIYPHALRKKDTYFPDLYYIEYSPERIEKAASVYFNILKHEQAFDGRKIGRYDTQPYNPGTRTFKNGYLLLAHTPI